MKRLAVYTAIFNQRDNFKEPPSGDFDFIVFTDNLHVPCTSRAVVKGMQQPVHGEPVRSARKIKALSHVFLPEYEYTAWVDGSFIMKKDIEPYVAKCLQDADIAVHAHPLRNCIFEEANAVLTYQFEKKEIVQRVVERYRREGFPEKYGLAATGILFRNNRSSDVINFNNAWWGEIAAYSQRDQLSFNYVMWKLGLRHHVLEGNLYDNEHFRNIGHGNVKLP